MNVELEAITTADVVSLHSISVKTFVDAFGTQNTAEDMNLYLSEAMTQEKLLSEIQNPHTKFYFAKINDIRAGYIKVNIDSAQSEKLGNSTLEIERIYVDKAFHGHKLGGFLINSAFEIAKNMGKTKVWLGVWEKNINAIEFYKHMGFETFGTHQFMLGNDLQTDVLMEKLV
jgi:diamine N-acetyltransferase